MAQRSLAVIAFLLIASKVLTAVGADRDQDKFQGIWAVLSVERDGKAVPAGEIKDARVVIEGDRITTRTNGSVSMGVFSLEPAQDPKAIDVSYFKGSGKGIYALEGDTLRLCLGFLVKERPKDFGTRSGSGLTLMTLKRAKP